ncbi:TetR/AcrR family transcriptional regulator [Priestia flexa]
MKKGEKRKNQIVQDISIYILENGVQTATLRNLAEAASTSDRMLMHYFRDKEELLTVALNSITDEFITILDSARTEQKNFVDLLPYLREMMKHPGIKPYIKLCLELAAIAAKKKNLFTQLEIKCVLHFWTVLHEKLRWIVKRSETSYLLLR